MKGGGLDLLLETELPRDRAGPSRILAPILDHAKNLENNRPIDNLTNNATTTMRAAVIFLTYI